MASLEHFKDRETAIAAFDRLWDAPAPWILAFTGMSGQGKSTLLDWLEANRCLSHNLPYALIGIGEHAGNIRDAFHLIMELVKFTSDLSDERFQQYRVNRERAIEERNRRKVSLDQRQEMHGSTGEQLMSANLAEAYREMEAQADEVIFDAWLDCLEGLSDQARIILLLDNYDTFQDGAAIEDLNRFWQVVRRAYNRVPGLRVVLACREKIRHQNDIRVFRNGLLNDALLPLTAADSGALLISLGVTDPAYRQAVFTNLAQGHPLVTRMAADAWLEAAEGIAAGDVPRQSSREEAVEWVQGRILDRLRGPLKEAVRWSALLRWFHADSLETILDSDLSINDFQTLTRYAFIIRPRLSPQAWACHDLVRRVQIAYLNQERPQAFQKFHQRARGFYLEQGALFEALYHAFFINQEEAFDEWQEAEGRAAFAFDHMAWAALLEIGLAPELDLPQEMLAKVHYRAGRRHYYRAEWDEAMASYGQSLERFNAIGSVLGQANVLKAIGDVYQFRKELDEALASYAQALEQFNAAGEDLGKDYVIKAIKNVEKYKEDEQKLSEALVEPLAIYLRALKKHQREELAGEDFVDVVNSVILFREDIQYRRKYDFSL